MTNGVPPSDDSKQQAEWAAFNRSVPGGKLKVSEFKIGHLVLEGKQAQQAWSVLLKSVMNAMSKMFEREKKAFKELGPDGGDDD